MANDKNKSNELAVDEIEATAELELLTVSRADDPDGIQLEVDADTCNFEQETVERDRSVRQLQSDLDSRDATINRLRYDIEQLRSRWLGLETEIGAREELTRRLNTEIAGLKDSLQQGEKLLRERDESIVSLKREIRERHEQTQVLIARHQSEIEDLEQQKVSMDRILEVEDTGQYQRRLAEQAGRIASHEAELRELKARYASAERYGDSLRRQLQEQTALADEAQRERETLTIELERSRASVADLATANEELREKHDALEARLAAIDEQHELELRKVRFELGEAQETISQQDLINEQLTSDLVETRGFKVELESMLDRTDREARVQIEELEVENRRLKEEARDFEEKLASKSEAIKCLLAELATRSRQMEHIGEIENVIQDIDQRMSGTGSDRGATERPAAERDRVTRLLVGSVEGQELRFPLFKDKLTIGRTGQNDIQLKAPYISRRHAVIVTEGDITRVIDWGSKNGVFVNSRRVNEHFLTNGDIVAIGLAKFRYEERPKRDGT
ncbi:MAG: FHA domain-containing protein [Woeseiaceae bacterium]|nr:FHA domain-containing protein [Woeseiaceae bacterium]